MNAPIPEKKPRKPRAKQKEIAAPQGAAHLWAAALAKARELGKIPLDERANERRAMLMKLLRKHSENVKKLADAAKQNGLLDEAIINAALDRAIAAAEVIDKELEELLAQAKKR